MTFFFCSVGKRLFIEWSELEIRRRPRANPETITAARKLYYQHRKDCRECEPLTPEMRVIAEKAAR